MFSERPLLCGWTLTADELPEREESVRERVVFSLPGAQALSAFSDLLGIDADATAEDAADEPETASMRFDLPGALPSGVRGRATLSREIDFGRMIGDRAALEIDHLCGAGHVLLGEKTLCSFYGGESAHLDLTDALRLGRKQTLEIAFDDAADAGVFGAVMLRTTSAAQIEAASLDPDATKQTLQVTVRIRAQRAGTYAVRAAIAGTQEKSDAPWRETRAKLATGAQEVRFALSMRAPCFVAGRPYVPPVLKLTLLYIENERRGMIADARTMMAGYPGDAPKAYVPLAKKECVLAPDALLTYAKTLHVDALYTPSPMPQLLLRRSAFEGVALMAAAPDARETFSPCMTVLDGPLAADATSPAAACWQLCGMPAMPPVPDEAVLDHELMIDAAGRLPDLDDPETARRMQRLRALQIRLRAEAARQGQYTGALCAPGEWRTTEIAQALETALSPLHLSVLPLRGAWWTQSFFSATVQVFIPEDMRSGAYAAEVILLDAQAGTIASFVRDCGVQGGLLGIIEGRLPEHPCVLTLRARLLRSGAAVEMQEIPVYVGERGPLEAAFI